MTLSNPRQTEADVDPAFPDRWSPRSFIDEPLHPAQIAALFEAARWAPSSANTQPWLFVYAVTKEDREKFLVALNESNQRWAVKAPMLAFLFAQKNNSKSGKPLGWARFDCGASWMSLALQARKLGLHAHAMAGFDAEKVYAVTGAPREDWDAVAAIVVGRRGDPSALPEDLLARELPNERKPLSEVALEGGFS